MNDIFDIRRFGAFALKWYKEKSILSMLMWVLLFTLAHIRAFFWEFGKYAETKEEFYDLIDGRIMWDSLTYVGWLIIIIMVLTLTTSWKLFSIKTRGYWLLPVSKLEKLVFVIVNSVILPIILYTSFYFAVYMVNDYKYVGWNSNITEISIEAVEKEYGDVVKYTHGGNEYYKVYPKIAFTDLFVSNAWHSKVPIIVNNEIKKATVSNGVTEKKAWDGIWDTFWLIFLGFTMILWVCVSPYKKSMILAIVSHTVFLLVIWGSVVLFVVIPVFSSSDESCAYSFRDGWGLIYLLFQSKIYYLLPIAYLWVVWKKIETMQIK